MPPFDVFCDVLMDRHTAAWFLFVLCMAHLCDAPLINNGRMFASLAMLSLFRTVALPVQVPLTTGRKSQFFIAKIDQFQNSASEGTFCRLARETRETISDSAECYAGLSVRFESSAAFM